jgi:hypothetical protein
VGASPIRLPIINKFVSKSLYSRQLVNKIRGWFEANDHPKVTVFGVELISYMKDVSKTTQNL